MCLVRNGIIMSSKPHGTSNGNSLFPLKKQFPSRTAFPYPHIHTHTHEDVKKRKPRVFFNNSAPDAIKPNQFLCRDNGSLDYYWIDGTEFNYNNWKDGDYVKHNHCIEMDFGQRHSSQPARTTTSGPLYRLGTSAVDRPSL